MKKGATNIVKMKSTVSPYYYTTVKNKRNNPDKMERSKYDPVARCHAVFKEAKI